MFDQAVLVFVFLELTWLLVWHYCSRVFDLGSVDGVPTFIHQCTTFIEEHGLVKKGIFRVSGDQGDLLALKQRIDFESGQSRFGIYFWPWTS